MMQKSDFSSAVQRGLTIGGGVGVLGALAGLGLSQGAGAIAGGVILAAGLGGAAAGAWIGGMLGLSAGNSHLKTYEGAIERGELLLMLDVPRTRVDEITDLVKLRHPQAQSGGTDPFIPVFP